MADEERNSKQRKRDGARALQIAAKAAKSILQGKMGVCWRLLAEHARMCRVAQRSGRALLHGK
eukprot:3565042-Prymnesium_polylepis.3